MQARIGHPALTVPGMMPAILAVNGIIETIELPGNLHELVNLRASQINGCSVCVDMHGKALKRAGESDERLFAVAAWHDTVIFSEAERAALALTEATTRLSDRSDPVPDEVWDEAARHFSEEQLAALVLSIAQINFWNRLNAATRQIPGGRGD